jgi:hypothetical protein
MNALSSTFEVSCVPRATTPLPEIGYRQAIDCHLSQQLRDKKRRLPPKLAGRSVKWGRFNSGFAESDRIGRRNRNK